MTKQWEPLTDAQWAAISPFFNLIRKRRVDLRAVVDAILWLLRTGAQWRNLPGSWPHWQAVYFYFDKWKSNETFERINLSLNQLDRKREGRNPNPSALCIDSQSVKLAPFICEYRGLDANKRVNGRKRQLVVDTQGRLWAADVHAANEGDGPGAIRVIGDILWGASERLEKVYGDQAYNGVFKKQLWNGVLILKRRREPSQKKGLFQ